MLNKNHWLTGFVIALILPTASYIVFYLLYPNRFWLGKPAVPYLIAMGVNLVFMKISVKKDAYQTAIGLVIATFAFLLFMVFVLKIKL
ncbi:hypothetical protein [Mucilaginibacter lacusdianchii]|uniref:hypothetical protein n=1 Tax=Mucilaginibacter lacusdianchii TaxID=2684211 RepID=UPI00131BBB3E|nr:hypothetical protein [Mucilaginibacter sp. JXJ CY 39]